MEDFFTSKDLLYAIGFAITIIGFWHRLESRVKDAAKREAVVDSRLTALEKIDTGHEKRMDANFARLFERLDKMEERIHSIETRLTKLETKLEGK